MVMHVLERCLARILRTCSLLPAALSFRSLGDAFSTLHVTQEELLAQSKFNAVCLHLKGWGPPRRYTVQGEARVQRRSPGSAREVVIAGSGDVEELLGQEDP